LLPGYQDLADSAPFEKIWGKPVAKKPGKSAEEMLTAIQEGGIKALYIMGCDPQAEFPEPDLWEEALGKLEWLAVQDIFPTEVANKAHYVFPAVTFAEKDGTFTNGERRIQRIAAAIEPYRNALSDWEIVRRFSEEMHYPMSYSHPSEIMEEISSLVRFYEGIRYDTLGTNGVQWPLHGEDGSPRVSLRDLNFSFSPVTAKDMEEEEAGDFDLITGTAFFHSGTLSTWAEGLNVLGRGAWVEMNRQDAERIGCKEGESVAIASSQKSIKAKLKISAEIPQGVVFVPCHFRDAKVNTLIVRSNHCKVQVSKG
jgi:predicted molibdopterin-dependent oxidoreductase YjgC